MFRSRTHFRTNCWRSTLWMGRIFVTLRQPWILPPSRRRPYFLLPSSIRYFKDTFSFHSIDHCFIRWSWINTTFKYLGIFSGLEHNPWCFSDCDNFKLYRIQCSNFRTAVEAVWTDTRYDRMHIHFDRCSLRCNKPNHGENMSVRSKFPELKMPFDDTSIFLIVQFEDSLSPWMHPLFGWSKFSWSTVHHWFRTVSPDRKFDNLTKFPQILDNFGL